MEEKIWLSSPHMGGAEQTFVNQAFSSNWVAPLGPNVNGFEESLGIKNLDYSFRTAQKVFNEWREDPSPKIGDFIKKLPANFFTLTDSLIVARTRKMIDGKQTGLTFPIKTKPVNLFVTPSQLGNFEGSRKRRSTPSWPSVK